MKIDPYRHKERYFKWKEAVRVSIPGITRENSDLIKQYINDMEYGVNISASNIKGSRSYIRLNTLRDKLVFFAKRFDQKYEFTNETVIRKNIKKSGLSNRLTKEEIKVKIAQAKSDINIFYENKLPLRIIVTPLMIDGVEYFNVGDEWVPLNKLMKFLDILEMTPYMYWIAYRDAKNRDEHTAPMLELMRLLFIEIVEDSQIKIVDNK